MHPRYAPAVIALVGVLSTVRVAEAEGSIGCLFSKSLCESQVEWCYDVFYGEDHVTALRVGSPTLEETSQGASDKVHIKINPVGNAVKFSVTEMVNPLTDYAFGKCLRYYDEERPLDLYQYDLNQESLYQLKNELEKLMRLGYRWGHPYTQCVLKSFLFSVRQGKGFDENICYGLADDNLRSAMKAVEGYEDGGLDPATIARIKFSRSFEDPRSLFSDEVYYPALEGRIINGPEDARNNKPDYMARLRQLILLDNAELSKNYAKRHRFGNWVPDGEGDEPIPELPKPIEYVEFQKPKIHFTERYNTPEDFREGFETKDFPEIFMDEPIGQIGTFSRMYNTPDNFRRGMESRDDVIYPGRSYSYEPQEREYLYDTFGEDNGRVYTEGGSLDLREKEKGDETPKMEEVPEDWGFKRRERLDVKKPGPAFKTNNYAFKTEKPETETARVAEDVKKEPPPPKISHLEVPEKKKFDVSSRRSPAIQNKKEPFPDNFVDSSDTDQVDTSFAYIQFKNGVTTWQEGSRIVRGVEEILKLDENTFTDTRVDPHEVTFKVESNKYNLNATDVARRIDAEKSVIKKKLGIDVISTGVGDKAKLPLVMNLSSEDEHQLWILSFLLCGVIAALAIAGAAFFVIKRHSRTRQKIQNLTQLDSEVSKDYQDLCRARMATKSPQEKPESSVIGHRITSLARESEGSNHSPSSRSSTSSWSEEPALTNMDISTGHMVLSYMEDHLKNKDRLEQEWVALCAYEAEPCATTIAEMPENSSKNRYGDILPYDHARVTLKELSNMTGSNYINASTITDHDPRNPAYIATQGPLPDTAPDFWQMVWEQGSVVMVMLTRLTENGSAMCHRYWPEEGSALYHIYEVHLVSEHIWCDDYLVRSFYLKNIQTGETRTVTQFHFLSWPENGVPLSTKALLEFRRKVNKSYRGRSCPIVVHCSDGVGRTGTYCLIDMVLNRMAKGAKEIDIAATLEHIRDQRPLMVRTKQQFEFVLMAVAEEVHAILKALPNNHSPSPILKDKE